MKTPQLLSKLVSASALALALGATGMSGAQAAAIVCGDLTLGLRTVTVDPAQSCLYAGLTNLGDGALVSQVNSLITPDIATLIDRDTTNADGGLLDITGVGALTGTWDLDASVWNDSDRLFMYFHFGDARDNPGPTSTTDPDIFIVELASANLSGTWSFSGKNGLSNIALLGVGKDGTTPPDTVPEPGVVLLMGAGLLGLGLARRRKSA